MARWACGPVLLLALGPALAAAPPRTGGPYKAAVGEVIEVEVVADPAGKVGLHNPYDVAQLFVREAVPRRDGTVSLIVQPKERGVFRLACWTVGEATGATLTIDAAGDAPAPKPVDPKVEPKPVDPKPAVLPAAPDGEARVLLVFDPDTLSAQTEARKAVVYGAKVRDYLDAALGQDKYRVYQTTVAFPAGSTSPYKAMAARPRTGDWWVVVTRGGKVVFEGPMPADPDAALALFKKHLGG